MMRAQTLGLALLLVGVIAAPTIAAEAPGTRFGASLSPVPLILENWQPDPAVLVVNTGDIPIRVALELAGDGYALGLVPVAPLAAGDTMRVPVTAAGPGEATVTVTATNPAASGMDRPSIVLVGTIRHATILETHRWIVPAAILAALLFGLVILWAVRRRVLR